MSFLAGDSEMARRIREFDWDGHPIGPPDTWSQSLRSALGIALNSTFPTAIYWGSELRLLYNDAWSTIPGPRHPACLGEPAREVWSDIWHVIEPQLTQVIETGLGLFLDDQMLPMRRHGFEEETYWSYTFTPIRGADGSIEGIFNSGMETTSKVLQQRHAGFLLQLSDAFRECRDSGKIMETACRMLGGHLNAIRVGFREVSIESEQYPVRAEWAADGVDAAGPALSWDRMGPIATSLSQGHVVRIDRTEDLGNDSGQALLEIGAASVLAIPWHRSGELAAVLFIHRGATRPWEDETVELVENVLSRVMQALEQERAHEREKAMLQEIDHRARNMLGVSQALIRMVRADDVETFRDSVLERMGALGNTLSVLSKSSWMGADLEDLIRSELAPYLPDEGKRITLNGCKVMIASQKAQPVAMALHELVTNAVKYGALSIPDGRLDVSWKASSDGVLEIEWTENKLGPESERVNSGSGFGSKLLEMMIERQLGGRLKRTLLEQRFDCRIEIPLQG